MKCQNVEQLDMFDSLGMVEEGESKDDSMLDEYALVYLVARAGGIKGNLFILKTEDAKTFCSDDCSHGYGRGGPWCMMWTTIRHFVHQNDTYDGRLKDFVFIFDTGKQDKDFERLGIKKPTLKEQTDILHKMGYVMAF